MGDGRNRGVRAALVCISTFAIVVSSSAIASAALPSTTPDETLGVNGKVREIVQVGDVLWVAGKFTALVDRKGNVVQSGTNGLAAIDATTGLRATGVSIPSLGGSNVMVWDLSTNGSDVYAAGTFDAANGSKNLLEFDGTTGSLGDRFSAPALKSVLVDGSLVLGGGAKMSAWTRAGAKASSFATTTVKTNSSLRGHNTPPMYTDIAPMPGGGWITACKCDWALNPGESTGTSTLEKAIVRLLPDGRIDHTWNKQIKASSGAFGWKVEVDSDGILLAAGGSDYTQKLTFDGRDIWKTNTNGSSQAVIRFDDRYIVGGHFRCVGNDEFHPRLVALTLSGARDPSWVIPITPHYNGVWALHKSGSSLWIGGEFTKVGGVWSPENQTCSGTKPTASGQTTQYRLARFS
jgi:hypothetical protein